MNTMPGTRIEADRRLLDTVIYLASLASDPKVIDPLLNTVRSITASLSPGQPIPDNNRGSLVDVREQLKEHLLHHDSLLQFTPATLEAKLADHFGGPDGRPLRRRTLKQLGYLMIAVFASFVAGSAMPWPVPAEQRMIIGGMSALAVLYIGISWLFLDGLQNFNFRLRWAYQLICIGYIVTGIGVAVSPLAQIPMLADQLLLRYGALMPVFVVANIFIYLGTQIFAVTLGAQSWATRRGLVLGGALGLAVLSAFVPHVTVEPQEWWFDASSGSSLAMSVLALSSSVVAYSIATRTTQMYARAMKWFSATMAAVAIAASILTGMVFAMGKMQGASIIFVTVMFSVAGVFMVISSYQFKRSSGSS